MTGAIFEILDYTVQNFHKRIGEDDFDRMNDGMRRVLQVMKNNCGTAIRREGMAHGVNFFREMEWRYTPMVAPQHNQVYADFIELEKDFPNKPHLPSLSLPLTYTDINWIIVETTEKVPELVEALRHCKNLFSCSSEFEILLTKILSLEQIQKDL